jgi:hypothetical protein
MLVSYNITTWCYNPQGHNLNLHCHENLKHCDSMKLWCYTGQSQM